MIERLTQNSGIRDLNRLAKPSLSKEALGIGIMLLLIVFVDRTSNYLFNLGWGGLIYIGAVIYVTRTAGLRSALVSCGLLVVYAWLVYHYPINHLIKDHTKATQAVITTAIFFPTIAIITGVVQNKLREAAIREFDARAVAVNESQQRRIAEAELWASEEMRRLIIDSSVDAVIGVTEDGQITMWNPNAEALFGWTKEEAIGSSLGQRIITPRMQLTQAPNLHNFLHSSSGPGARKQIEMIAQTKEGSDVSIELYIADHKTEGGSIFIVFARDISERKRAEQAIQELNARLEERVAERTSQLEAANEELVGFTYSVSHDLRAPLRAIVSNSRIVCDEAEDRLDAATFERLKRLEINALKMSELIENLLQFARIGQVALIPQTVDFSALAREIATDLEMTKPGQIVVQPGMVVEGDPEMLKMVMFNLMENAWKYVRPDQEPRVEVGRREDGVFYVKDEGIGFDMKYVDKIWEPFERLHRDMEYPGTGIGLANSRRIITRHGGKIWTQSTPNGGTTMFFELGGMRPLVRARTDKQFAR